MTTATSRRPPKPHLYKSNGFWLCVQEKPRRILYGSSAATPAGAFANLRAIGGGAFMQHDHMVQWVKDQAEKRKRVAAEHAARGECPECDGSGEIGGQFSGGDVLCPSCAGTGRLSQGNQS